MKLLEEVDFTGNQGINLPLPVDPDNIANKQYVDDGRPYSIFIYNSSGGQANNRFNDWADLMAAIALVEGPKQIIFEQNETIPTGAWNLDYVTLRGNGQEYNACLLYTSRCV